LLNALGHRARHFCQARATKAFQSGKKRNYESGVCERLAFELLNYVGIVGIVTRAATLLGGVDNTTDRLRLNLFERHLNAITNRITCRVIGSSRTGN
jgi:hypothetical protein